MFQIDIEKKAIEIKQIISVYTKESFIGFLADFIRNNPIRNFEDFTDKIKSKLKDSLYLIALRLSADEGTIDFEFNDETKKDLIKVADIVNEIVSSFLASNYTEKYLHMDSQIKYDLFIHETTFKNYFQNGVLNFVEQEVNHIVDMFNPYNDKIKEKTGLDLYTYIDFYYLTEKIYKERVYDYSSFLLDKSFNEMAQGKKEFDLNNLSEEVKSKFLDFYERTYLPLIFTISDFNKFIDEDKLIYLLDIFSIDINNKIDFTYYTQKNPLDFHPIIKLNDDEYLNVFQKQLPTSIYNHLFNVLGESQKTLTQLYKRRGKLVFEGKTLEIFKFFFKDKSTKIYHNYNLNGSEQDILIIHNRIAYIIECKTSRFREPMRDTEKAYKRIKEDFKTSIQEGYNQCLRVEKEIFTKDKIVIETKNEKVEIETSNILNVFSIVVTLERYGAIQTDLSLLLEKENEEDFYPFSIFIDDLEIFLLSLNKKFNNPYRKFEEYLEIRQLLNGKIMSADELDICAMFLKNSIELKKIINNHSFIIPDPLLQDVFDKMYFGKEIKVKLKYESKFINSVN
ncbi:MAG: NERD domain-containing protein [Flavobacterium sp.]|uniref:NERD domain-containing protein n=1 Tax=Flavobacterium sp. TaxID=239 RepID=UPI0037900EFB